MKISNVKILFQIILILTIVSCSNKNEKELKPVSTKVNGDLESFISVVDGTYKVELVSNEMSLNLKLKIEKLLEAGKEFDELSAQVIDEKGMPLTGVGNFYISKGLWTASDDNSNLDQALKKGSGEVIISLRYSDMGSLTKTEALKIISDKGLKFILNTKLKKTDASNSSNSLPGIYPIASTQLLTSLDLENYTKYDLKIMRNEIFARYGFIFKTEDLKSYFTTQPWYKPQSNDVTNKLSEIEKKNIELIKAKEPYAPNSIVDNNGGYYNEDGTPSNSSNNSSYDELINSYDRYIDQYINLLRKAKNNDMSALTEYPEMLRNAHDLQSKLSNVQGQLNTSQLQKFIKLQQKFANASLELMK